MIQRQQLEAIFNQNLRIQICKVETLRTTCNAFKIRLGVVEEELGRAKIEKEEKQMEVRRGRGSGSFIFLPPHSPLSSFFYFSSPLSSWAAIYSLGNLSLQAKNRKKKKAVGIYPDHARFFSGKFRASRRFRSCRVKTIH